MQAMILVSVFGALNVNVLVGPRVLFAVARDHAFLRRFSRIDPRMCTPAWAIAGMCGWASALILLGGLSWDPNVRVVRHPDRVDGVRRLDFLLLGRGGGVHLAGPPA